MALISRIRAEWAFDLEQGWARRMRVHNALWLALEPILPRRIHRPLMESRAVAALVGRLAAI